MNFRTTGRVPFSLAQQAFTPGNTESKGFLQPPSGGWGTTSGEAPWKGARHRVGRIEPRRKRLMGYGNDTASDVPSAESHE